MSVKTKQLFQRYEKFLGLLRIGNYRELFWIQDGENSEHFKNGFVEKYGRDFIVISGWEPTSQICSCCGFKGGKLDLSIREWECRTLWK